MQIIHSDVRHFKPKQDNLLEYLNKEELPRKFLCSIFYVAILFSLLASFYINELNISLYLYIEIQKILSSQIDTKKPLVTKSLKPTFKKL